MKWILLLAMANAPLAPIAGIEFDNKAACERVANPLNERASVLKEAAIKEQTGAQRFMVAEFAKLTVGTCVPKG